MGNRTTDVVIQVNIITYLAGEARNLRREVVDGRRSGSRPVTAACAHMARGLG